MAISKWTILYEPIDSKAASLQRFISPPCDDIYVYDIPSNTSCDYLIRKKNIYIYHPPLDDPYFISLSLFLFLILSLASYLQLFIKGRGKRSGESPLTPLMAHIVRGRLLDLNFSALLYIVIELTRSNRLASLTISTRK